MDFDELKMQQIMYNLISNAIKFTPVDGSIVVVLRSVQVRNGKFLQLHIQDSGIGIPDKELAHIFDRFYQVDESQSNRGRGSGIGLALTKELVNLMDGQISVESDLNKGTTFTILLEITQQAVLASEKNKIKNGRSLSMPDLMQSPELNGDKIPVDQPNQLDRPQLLIIEDNKDVATYIESCVEANFSIHFAVDGADGIQKAFDLIPDIIISDVMMPEKDGYEVTYMLKKDERTSHIPIILLTAKATANDKVQGLEVGADAYLTKPFHKEELMVRLRKLIELRKQLQVYYTNLDSQLQIRKKDLSLDEIFVRKLNALINKELGNPEFSPRDLCQSVMMSQSQLYRKVKALTGKTPALFIRSIRLARAVQLLREGELNISEVAYRVGFSDPNYFSHIFAQEFGKTPSSVISR